MTKIPGCLVGSPFEMKADLKDGKELIEFIEKYTRALIEPLFSNLKPHMQKIPNGKIMRFCINADMELEELE